jgi:hypothetical protein
MLSTRDIVAAVEKLVPVIEEIPMVTDTCLWWHAP